MNSSPEGIAQTKTGSFPIGIRRGGSAWQKDLPGFLAWAKENRFGVVDFTSDGDRSVAAAKAAGLRVGSADLPDLRGMLSSDGAVRAAAVEKNVAYVAAATEAYGPLRFLTVMLPPDTSRTRAENFDFMVESYNRLTPTLEKHGARVVIEGWPGPGALCCTPEGCSEFFARCPSPALGVNYDPSHLVRMGIDPLRFLREFISRVHHVHGKDTELLSEGLYRYGNLQEPTLGKPRHFGGMHWRYVIPGHGASDWPAIFRILAEAGYRGAVTIELEDEEYNGAMETEKQGLLAARDFLAGY